MFEKFYDIGGKLVYYKDLERTYPEIYKKLLATKQAYSINYSTKMSERATRLRSFAKVEAQKEIRLLEEYFGVSNLKIDENTLYNNRFGKDLVNAVNTSLQLKEVYERHYKRIAGINGKDGHAKITSAQFFATYFSDELFKLVKNKLEELKEKVKDMTIESIYDIIFSDEIIHQALYNTFFVRLKNSGDWSSKDESKGYQELFNQIEKFNKDEFLDQIYNLYKLKDLRVSLKEMIMGEKEIKEIFSNARGTRSKFKRSLKETTTQKGTLAEIMGNEMMLIVQNNLKDGKNFTIKKNTKVVGDYKNKPDIVATFGVDIDKILKIIEQRYNNRRETVNAFKELDEHLRKLKSGFVVYTNVKDYTLSKYSKGYDFNGFSTGNDISLRNFEGVISNTPGGSKEIIGQIMSTLDGAIYSDQIERLENELCDKLAYFLFDDVTTIGKDTAAGNHTIHLLLLDGIYIPLSYLFYLMSEAISEIGESKRYEPTDLFDIKIKVGKVKYPENGILPEDWDWAPGQWTIQQQEAYDNIRIGAKFLKSFIDIVSELKR